MTQPITRDQWLKAQEAERRFHNEDFEAGLKHYAESYKQYFKWLGIESVGHKVIVEIGPADFPALGYIAHGQGSTIIEPMPSEHLRRFNIPIITECAEDVYYLADEVWLFNVLQHVIYPYKIVERAKAQARCIRFFEPIDYGIDQCHPWNLTEAMFKEWFGECVQVYPGNPNAVNFHTHKCAYGVWRRTE